MLSGNFGSLLQLKRPLGASQSFILEHIEVATHLFAESDILEAGLGPERTLLIFEKFVDDQIESSGVFDSKAITSASFNVYRRKEKPLKAVFFGKWVAHNI
jgi:hypothetical protein